MDGAGDVEVKDIAAIQTDPQHVQSSATFPDSEPAISDKPVDASPMQVDEGPSTSKSLENGDLEMVRQFGNNWDEKDGWNAARAWLWSLPRRRNVTFEEVEEWVIGNKHRLSREIVTMPRSHLFRFLLAQHKLMRRTEQMENLEVLEPPTARFRRSDKWKPVYAWLESLNMSSVVGAKAIDAWLDNNPSLKEELLGKHSRHHLFHYIQKCHTNLVKKKKKLALNNQTVRSDDKKKKKKKKKKKPQQGAKSEDLVTGDRNSNDVSDNFKLGISSTSITISDDFFHSQRDYVKVTDNVKPIFGFMDKEEARKRYDILSLLQTQLLAQIVCIREQLKLNQGNVPLSSSGRPSTSMDDSNRPGCSRSGSDIQSMTNEDVECRLRRKLRDSTRAQQENSSWLRTSTEIKSVKKRRKAKDRFNDMVQSWVYSEVLTGFTVPEEREKRSSSSDVQQSLPNELKKSKVVYNPVRCIQERELGSGAGHFPSPFTSFQKGRRKRWKLFFEGWDSLEKQFTGCGVWLQRRAFSSWLPCWSAYTSSVAVAAPLGTIDQGVQKVLDVRFHPKNEPRLVCSSNAAPNELLLYDLLSGKATELVGHNCQIQAVEFAADGHRIVSCGTNILKIWDSITGACLYTCGPGPWDENASGHTKKINALSVNQRHSCLVATSGARGDNRILLWNVNAGELTCDLNADLRNQCTGLPCMDALEFCDQNLLICGSDSSGGPAIVQIWDVQAPGIVKSFPANDSYITSLKANPSGTTIASGAGDGSVALFDIRTCGGITRIPLGSSCEITSVSFSSCGMFLQASSTSNKTLVWDMRMLPTESGPISKDAPPPLADRTSRKTRALHCLSHGKPMPTSDNAGQLPGFVDEGDQGVNDARWFHNDSILVTASGNGSIAMWDMSLGDPCIRHMTSHTRCVNTVVISPNDRYICSGGDDQKVVLYQDTMIKSKYEWRLTHPLVEEPPDD